MDKELYHPYTNKSGKRVNGTAIIFLDKIFLNFIRIFFYPFLNV